MLHLIIDFILKNSKFHCLMWNCPNCLQDVKLSQIAIYKDEFRRMNCRVFLIFTVFLGRRFLFSLPAPCPPPHSLWLAPSPPLFGKFQSGAFASKLCAQRKRLHCRLGFVMFMDLLLTINYIWLWVAFIQNCIDISCVCLRNCITSPFINMRTLKFNSRLHNCVFRCCQSVIVAITSNEPWNTEMHKTDRNPSITNHGLLNPLK